ncbi:tryptophan synthase subunit alpha [Streptomyces sp. A3M-1-3]|uniref:tryptophan synthase subunit alpha n=1 Tax=Streptomyces sp. A3M-1-3 TaxID=2962044 RepID=UPI0020B6C35B|nr:tryptophan synthase subunit alpha [Streptomyces sp. A3M-1-3]MCP3821379.1 tryptophan synthase subunit alpha [Streptomyces sp. A3M-1-3]
MPAPTEALRTTLAQPRCSLGVFVPAGLHPPTAERRVLERLASSGTDVFEIGLAHHTPFLDGPVIQSAYRRALHNGNVLDRTLRAVEHAARHAPTVVMTYWEAVTQHGPEGLAHSFADTGAAGVMVVDLPDEAADTWREIAATAGLTAPRFAPRTSTERQLGAISATASGWLYAPASAAPTGYRGHLDLEALSAAVRRLRSASPLPVVSGVGISTPLLAAAVAPLVDAVVIGTPVVRALDRGPDAASALVAAYARALQHRPR